MEDVEKLVEGIRTEISEYKALMGLERYSTAVAVAAFISELGKEMLQLAQQKGEKEWHEQA